ncbi:MAG TPA: hypothetical protein VFF65_12070 [Phycisphaerales bacterium]|nr:hypothetical protein [Phycisphaerales bacterium]
MRQPRHLHNSLSSKDRIDICLSEYAVLYSLVTYRLNALDVLIPAAPGALLLPLGVIGSAPASIQVVTMTGLPLSTIWLLAAAMNHARSLTDAVERIALIEEAVNAAARAELIAFQSTHPSRGQTRTGKVTVEVVKGAAAVLLAGCLYLTQEFAALPAYLMPAYAVYIAVVAGALIYMYWRGHGYLYRPVSPLPIHRQPDGR